MTVDLAGLTADTREKVAELEELARREGFTLRIRSARRTCAEQAEQYAIGRLPGDTRAVVTHAKGCQSWHVQGRAVDVDIVAGPRDYGRIGALWKGLGGKWGGDFPGFPDVGHMEWHPGLTIEGACPNPDRCVDVVAGAGEARTSGPSTLARVVLAGAALVLVGGAAFVVGERL